MGQENYKISQLPEKTSADSTDLMEVSTLVDSSYESKKISVGQIAETAMGTMTYEDLTTTAKTIVGAINELVNSGPSIEVESLAVTENGTYTAEEGKAYSPVTVNVKSDIEKVASESEWWDDSYLVPITVDGNPVTLNSLLEQNAISTILTYSPKQSGSGVPSSQNIRPFVPWTEANLGVNSETPTITANLGGTYYGFSVDLERGVLRVTHQKLVFDGTEDDWGTALSGRLISRANVFSKNLIPNAKCNMYLKGVNGSTTSHIYNDNSDFSFCTRTTEGYQTNLYIRDSRFENDLDGFKAWIAEHNLEFAEELATPLELPLTPSTVALLAGNNTLWTDGDSISITYRR